MDMNIPDWLLGDKFAIGGAMGGVVRWLTLREDWKSGLISIIVGAICAVYASPLALPSLESVLFKLDVKPDQAAGLSGFLIGIGGVTFAGFLIDVWKIRRRFRDGG